MLTRLGAIFFALPCVLLLVLYGLELSTLTHCQELGQFYDAQSKSCTSVEPAFSSFYLRNTWLVNAALIIATISALLMTLGMMQQKSSRK